MADDKIKRGPPDGKRMNIHDRHELEAWAKHFGVTTKEIIECADKVGVMAADVKQCLGK